MFPIMENGNPHYLLVPFGDSIHITLFYNDTDSSDSYVGGIPNAESFCQIWGPTIPLSDYSVTELGNGNYSVLIDSLDPSIYITTGGEPVLSSTPYHLNVQLRSENRSTFEISLRISIIVIPTDVESLGGYPDFLTMLQGEYFTLELLYIDAWHGTPITDASVSVNCGDSNVLQLVTNINESETEPGLYHIEFLGIISGDVVVTITMEKDFYESHSESFFVHVELFPPPPPPPVPVGLITIIVILVFLYSRRNQNKSSETDTLPQPAESLIDFFYTCFQKRP